MEEIGRKRQVGASAKARGEHRRSWSSCATNGSVYQGEKWEGRTGERRYWTRFVGATVARPWECRASAHALESVATVVDPWSAFCCPAALQFLFAPPGASGPIGTFDARGSICATGQENWRKNQEIFRLVKVRRTRRR
jgi:hypothetical protein